MQDRYALRFENGERRGETIPIPSGGLTLGRRPGSSVQVLDASVSGRHAELSVDGRGVVTLRDLGSTNGTRVGGQRISEQVLKAGDEILVGNVQFTFLDLQPAAGGGDLALSDTGEIELEETAAPAVPARAVSPSPRTSPPPAAPRAATPKPIPVPSSAAAAGDEVHTIAPEKVARTRKKSLAAVVGLLVLLAAGAAAWFFLRGESTGGIQAGTQLVEPVEGNLLAAGYSFEEDRGDWQGDERSPAGFAMDSSARRSGGVGLLAELERAEGGEGEWALEQSPLVKLSLGRALRARAWLESGEGAEIQLGVRLESSQNAAAPTVLWAKPQASGESGEVEFVVDVPPVYDGARALLLARLIDGAQSGEAQADDVSLVAVASPEGRPKLGETELYLSGSGAVLFKIDHALLSDIHVYAAGRANDAGALHAPLAAELQANGLRLSTEASSGGAQAVSLFVEPGLAGGGLATTGEGGYRNHQVDFEREGADALFLGAGRDMVRVACGDARKISGRPTGGGFQVELEFPAAAEVFLQVTFREERDAAQTLARQARADEQAGRFGPALFAWSKLLDEYPYEDALVAEAGSARGRLEQAGHGELRLLRQRAERARFFRLLDIFRRCRDDSLALAERYTPSPVADEARALAAEVERDASDLVSQLKSAERGRLASIEAALRASGSTKLAERVRARLDELQGAR
jgi:pSer/pThr/pTyr-binding forkhead associated (FHA) protein